MAKACPHCSTVVDDGAVSCPGCGADLAPAEPTSSLPRIDGRALALWGVLVLPGLGLTLAALLVVDSIALLVAGLALLAIPLVVQLVGGEGRGGAG